ncbi:hypothetical protein CSB45_09345 [candidate division KSB3 bacterium]|uniref:SxtJ n=1 Tax=candidate division KSB3 bacterium TaxID=2044937 RepID=A0A2G6E473_9BACT|nr:MAG: hypothetical protein CSB45_09345 [candidate division KSB3 bacterium]PIE29470.1 MAG: hypothetical protein CSA57_08730 [candidate division KSB3 bacterium]
MREEILSDIQKLTFSKAELKKFAMTMAVVLGGLATIAWWRSSAAFPYLLGIALLFLAVGFTVPTALKQIYKGWMTLAIVMGFFMTKVILSLLFFSVFTGIGIFQRASGKDLLDEKLPPQSPDPESYWKPYERPKDAKRHLERQF